MVNTKVSVLLIIASVLLAVIVGIAFAEYASAQANASQGAVTQYPQAGYNGYYQSPQQGNYPYSGNQYGGSYGNGRGMGMGMCGRYW